MQEDGAQHFRAVMPPVLESVSRVRSELRQTTLRWSLPKEVASDAALVVSELATNAVLHARTAFMVVARRLGHVGIRIEVTDTSGDPVLCPVRPPPETSGVLEDLDELNALQTALADTGTTGRGLSVVATLSDMWGVSAGPSGKTVWAELGFPASAGEGPDNVVTPVESAPATGNRVLMVAVPVRLVVESDRHFDDLLRELQVMALAGKGGDLGALADEATQHLGGLRHGGRRSTRAALARGDRLIDIEVLIPPTAGAGFGQLESLLKRVSAESRAGRLLTGLPRDEVNAFRRWYRAEIEAQLAGRPPRVCPFPTVPEREPALAAAGNLAVDRERSQRLQALQVSLSELADPPVAADTVLAAAVGTLAGLRGAVFLLTEGGAVVRLTAQVGYPEEIVTAWQTFPLRSDLPASECIRTQRIVMLATRAERDRRYPRVRSLHIVDDPSAVCIPLRGSDGGIGCLSLTFRQGRALSKRQLSFLQGMADTAAEWFVAHGQDLSGPAP